MRDTRPDYPPEFDEWTEDEAREQIAELEAEVARLRAALVKADALVDWLMNDRGGYMIEFVDAYRAARAADGEEGEGS